MIDPLRGFDWQMLYSRYDALCKAFSSDAPYLEVIQPHPQSDRKLYYCLLRRIGSERRSPTGISLETYEALLYWKYYSQPAAINNICERIRQHPERDTLKTELTRLSQSLPDVLTRNRDVVLRLVKCLNEFALRGIKSQDALPTRTTLLHMVYPDVVPVFDKQVLKAVGGWDSEYANKSIRHLGDYLEHAWKLAEKHSSSFHIFTTETPLRLIDMALWVIRGGC